MTRSTQHLATALLVVLSLGVATVTARAEILADYQFSETSPGATTSDYSSSDAELTSTASDFSKGPGVDSLGSSAWGTPGRCAMVNGANQADEAGSISVGDYVTFSITPATGTALNLSELTFDLNRRFDYSPNGYSLFADEDPGAGGDNFSTLLASGTITTINSSTFTTVSTDLSSTSFLQNIADTTTFRLYLYGTTWTEGDTTDRYVMRLDTVQLTGDVVPEPSTYAMLLMAAVGISLFWRSR